LSEFEGIKKFAMEIVNKEKSVKGDFERYYFFF
jgi:hypothetical protein